MHCPRCKSEYRKGFTECADCGVGLVDAPPAESPASTPGPAPRPAAKGPLIDFCGFFSLDEARQARERLRVEGIACEIAIREAPGSDPAGPVEEEYWMRFYGSDVEAAAALLGVDESPEDAAPGSEMLSCSACGSPVASAESFCPRCGARFEGTA